MKKALSLSFAYVGTVIGAGFATGREIKLFFSSCSVFSVLFAGVLLGFFCYVILSLSSRFGDIFSAFGYLKPLVVAFAFIANFCVLSATVSGSGEVVFSLLHLSFGKIITAVVSLIVVMFGMKYVKGINLFIVPVIIVLVLVVFFKDESFDLSGKNSIVLPFSYASMNLISGGFLIGKDYKLNKKERFLTSFFSGLVLTALLVCIYLVTKGVDGEMPFIEKANSLNLGVVGNIVLYLAMLTTAVGTLSVCSYSNRILAVIITTLSLLVASFDFGVIVDALYPIVGAVGSVIVVLCVIIYFLTLSPKFSRYCNRLYPQDGSLTLRRLRRG